MTVREMIHALSAIADQNLVLIIDWPGADYAPVSKELNADVYLEPGYNIPAGSTRQRAVAIRPAWDSKL